MTAPDIRDAGSGLSTVKNLVAGSGLEFEDRGARALEGVPGERRLYAAPPPPRRSKPSVTRRVPHTRGTAAAVETDADGARAKAAPFIARAGVSAFTLPGDRPLGAETAA